MRYFSIFMLSMTLLAGQTAFAADTATDKCATASTRDATCLGKSQKDGTRNTDNRNPVLQKITNARAIPGKNLLIPVTGVLSTTLATPIIQEPPLCQGCAIP